MKILVTLTAALLLVHIPSTMGGTPAEATKDSPFVNSLGMKFMPVPGTKVLFCIHDTRNADYRQYALAVPNINGRWKKAEYKHMQVSEGEDHPVVYVNWDDAKGFCDWLTTKEGKTYRLPTDHEWSCAVGIGGQEDSAAPAMSKSGMIPNVYPWGNTWPLPSGSGNFADLTLKERTASHPDAFIPGYRDGNATTSPVMKFKPNALGLYDMAGNVWQWCDGYADQGQNKRIMRGGSWRIEDRESLLSSCRKSESGPVRGISIGFRVVVEK